MWSVSNEARTAQTKSYQCKEPDSISSLLPLHQTPQKQDTHVQVQLNQPRTYPLQRLTFLKAETAAAAGGVSEVHKPHTTHAPTARVIHASRTHLQAGIAPSGRPICWATTVLAYPGSGDGGQRDGGVGHLHGTVRRLFTAVASAGRQQTTPVKEGSKQGGKNGRGMDGRRER